MIIQSPTPKQIKAARLYNEILEEIKIRITAIDLGTSGSLHGLPPPIVREHCYLQIRMICELIAMGCLVAHGDISGTQSKQIQKEWNPQKIMETLERLHPHFYPYTVQQTLEKDGGRTLQIIDPSPLPKKDLLQIWNECGDFLHRGGLKKLIRQQSNPPMARYPDITKIAQRFLNVLSMHTIIMLGGELMFIALLQSIEHNNAAQVVIARRGEPSQSLK